MNLLVSQVNKASHNQRVVDAKMLTLPLARFLFKQTMFKVQVYLALPPGSGGDIATKIGCADLSLQQSQEFSACCAPGYHCMENMHKTRQAGKASKLRSTAKTCTVITCQFSIR